jgi:hypothetical protein
MDTGSWRDIPVISGDAWFPGRSQGCFKHQAVSHHPNLQGAMMSTVNSPAGVLKQSLCFIFTLPFAMLHFSLKTLQFVKVEMEHFGLKKYPSGWV